jgi:hypothetical protein
MPLVLIQNAKDDFNVMSGKLCVGRICRRNTPGRPEMQWLWALNGVHGGPDAMRIAGITGTLDQAQTELNESWVKWTAWANLQDSTPPPPPPPASTGSST